MSELKLYATGCHMCDIMEKKLILLQIPYTSVTIIEKIKSASKRHNLFSIPFLEYEGDVYTYQEMDALVDRLIIEKRLSDGVK